MAESRDAEFARRVAERLAEWAAEYVRMGAASESPLMDQIVAEEQVVREMRDEGRWPTRASYRGSERVATLEDDSYVEQPTGALRPTVQEGSGDQ